MQIHSRHGVDRQWKPISSHKRRFISRLRPSALNTAFVLFLTQRRAQGPERTGGREGGKAPKTALIENLQHSDEGIPPSRLQLDGKAPVCRRKEMKEGILQKERVSLMPLFKDCCDFYNKMLSVSPDVHILCSGATS